MDEIPVWLMGDPIGNGGGGIMLPPARPYSEEPERKLSHNAWEIDFSFGKFEK